MSLSMPRRRLFQSATSFTQSRPPHAPSTHLHAQRRPISLRALNPFKPKTEPILDPTALRRKIRETPDPSTSPTPKPGDLAPSSIFGDPPPTPSDIDPATEPRKHDPYIEAAALDPTPLARKRWQRKMVIRDIRGRGRLSKTEKIARTERQHSVKSPLIKTSVKKLYPLARQIAGKPLHEAMVQMRFSRKKAAQDVLRHLEFARDQAVVVRGMGLGRVRDEVGSGEEDGGKVQEEESVVVEDKKGRKRVVGDRSAMYVDEAWVGRGAYESGSDHRARGQIHRLRLPYTSISVVLKEEATRIRQAEEREAKRLRKKVWVPLPDRPITAQRQYPLW